MRTLLLDADILAYKIASAAQTVTQFPGCEPHVELAPWGEVLEMIDRETAAIQDTLGTDKLIVCLSVPTAEGWRVQVLPTYKAHRDPKAKPVLLQKVKDTLAFAFPSYTRPTLEADDVMGILSTHPTLIKGEKVIVSDDKDMGTIPGLWFRPGWVGGGGDSFVRTVCQQEADYFHMWQTLVGDTVDGYRGCPGIGPVKARNALTMVLTQPVPCTRPVDDMWGAVVDTFEARGYTEEDALVQARVARICRHTEYDFKTKQVRLWTPDSPARQSVAGTASTASTAPSRKAA